MFNISYCRIAGVGSNRDVIHVTADQPKLVLHSLFPEAFTYMVRLINGFIRVQVIIVIVVKSGTITKCILFEVSFIDYIK
jgi:hypothetical protein